MKNTDIHQLIERLNRRLYIKNRIFISALSATVDCIKIWEPLLESCPNASAPQRFYCIKNKEGSYVAAVLDMGEHNLHWYVLPLFRKQGHLTRAMQSVIINHLFEDREQQFITIDSTDHSHILASQRVALKLGFKRNSESAYINEYRLAPPGICHTSLAPTTPLGKKKIEELVNRTQWVATHLKMIHTELSEAYGENDCTDELKRLADLVYASSWYSVEEAWHQFEREACKIGLEQNSYDSSSTECN